MYLNRSIVSKFAPALYAIYVIALLFFINEWGTVESSEARYAEIAREMFTSGDWIHPRLMNIYHYHKPPFTYWLTGVGYYLFGINTFGARFFLAVSLLIQLLLIHRIALFFLKDKSMAFATALIYSTLPLVLVSIRGLTTDAYLQTFILLFVYFYIQWRTTQKVIWLYLIAIACGLGFLTKGPLILILPVFFVIGFYKSLPQVSFSYHHIISSLLFITIGFSWFIYLAIEDSAFVSYFLFRHTYERVANAGVFSRSEPFWYYLLYTPLVALPWTIILFTGFVKTKWRNIPTIMQKVVVFLILLPLTFFSLSSSKLILYVLPAFPGIAILSTYFLFQMESKSQKENYLLAYFIVVCLSFYGIRLFDKSINLPIGLLIPPIIMVIILIGLRLNKLLINIDRILLGSFIFTIFLLCYGALFMKYNELKINSTRPIAEWIEAQNLQNKTILVYNRLLPSLAFNLNKDITSLHDGNKSLKREVNFEKDDQWKTGLYDLTKPSEADRLLPVLRDAPVLIVKGSLQPSSQWLLNYFAHHHEEGDWIIYY
jgi:4-amino-4-deoxy-L-arabinose transferase